LLEFDRQEPDVDPDGDKAQEIPEDPFSDELTPAAVEAEPFSFVDHVVAVPANLAAVDPRKGDAKSEDEREETIEHVSEYLGGLPVEKARRDFFGWRFGRGSATRTRNWRRLGENHVESHFRGNGLIRGNGHLFYWWNKRGRNERRDGFHLLAFLTP
jgi:hypothetical protein